MMLTSVGMRRICMGPWQPSIWASSLKMSCARDATTGSEETQRDKLTLVWDLSESDTGCGEQSCNSTVVVFEEDGNSEGADLVFGAGGEGRVDRADDAQGLHDQGEHL